MNSGPLLEVRSLSVTLEGKTLLDGVSLVLSPGDCLLVRGHSGRGKSLLLRAIVGLVPATGDVLVGGAPIDSPAAMRARVTWIPQTPPRLPGTLRDNLLAVRDHAAVRARVEPLETTLGRVEALGLTHVLDRPADQLSGGEAQRLGLVRALQLQPDVVLLDEPTSALDPDSRAAVVAHLDAYRDGRALVWVAHSDAADALATGELVL